MIKFPFFSFFIIWVNIVIPLNSLVKASNITQDKINILESNLCKVCVCDGVNKQINCKNKLQNWFSPEQWYILQNGDIIFQTINLENNNLTTIPLLPEYPMENLYLGFNKIAEIENGAFQNLPKLSDLDLSHNKLTSKILIPDVFKGPFSPSDYLPLNKLTKLNLGYNELHNLDSDLFEHVPNLEELILCRNNFLVISKSTEIAISSLVSLKMLDLSYMELKELPDTIFHGPRELETLIMSGNLFDEIPESLELAKNLKTLVLDENPIEDFIGENIFPPMVNLQYLSICYMPKLSSIGNGGLSNLQNLTTLVASDNPKLQYIDPFALARNTTNPEFFDYPPLEKLYLNNNNITYLPRSLVYRWDKVTTIDLRYNRWNCDCSNDWLINDLIKIINTTNFIMVNDVLCDQPVEFKSQTVISLYINHDLNCYQNLFGRSSLILFGLLIGLLTGIPLTVGIFIIYRRGCCGIIHRNNSGAHRAFYNKASLNEDFHI